MFMCSGVGKITDNRKTEVVTAEFSASASGNLAF